MFTTSISLVQYNNNIDGQEEKSITLLAKAKSARKAVSETLAIEKILTPGSSFLEILKEKLSSHDFDKIVAVLGNVNYKEAIDAIYLKKRSEPNETRAVCMYFICFKNI